MCGMKAKLEEQTGLAKRLAMAMEQEDLAPRDLAKALGVSVQAVYQWMNTGQIHRDRIPDIARVTHVSADWLHTGIESTGVAEAHANYEGLTQEELRHLRAFRRLAEPQRSALTAFLRSLSR